MNVNIKWKLHEMNIPGQIEQNKKKFSFILMGFYRNAGRVVTVLFGSLCKFVFFFPKSLHSSL